MCKYNKKYPYRDASAKVFFTTNNRNRHKHFFFLPHSPPAKTLDGDNNAARLRNNAVN